MTLEGTKCDRRSRYGLGSKDLVAKILGPTAEYLGAQVCVAEQNALSRIWGESSKTPRETW